MSLTRSLFRFLLLHIPRSLFQIAGIVRAVNRGKRAFKKSLKEEGLPEEVVDVLFEEFSIDVSWRELLRKRYRE